MQVRLSNFAQNISFNSAREVALRNPITVAVAAVALGVFALYSLYTWWTTPKSFTLGQTSRDQASRPSSLPPAISVFERAQMALATISGNDRHKLSNLLGLNPLGLGIMELPNFKENIAQAGGLSIRSKMTAPIMFGVFTEGNPFIAIAVDSASDASPVQEVIVLFQENGRDANAPTKAWSQLKDAPGAAPRLFPYFFDENFVAAAEQLQGHRIVACYFEMEKLVHNEIAGDRNGNLWKLTKFDS